MLGKDLEKYLNEESSGMGAGSDPCRSGMSALEAAPPASAQEGGVRHELSHVVQQMHGRVKPPADVTHDIGTYNDSLEHEADLYGSVIR